MEGKDNIKDLFGEQLGSFEANVRPEMWANISSQIAGTTTIVGSTGVTFLAKTVISISIAATVALVSYIVLTMDNETKNSTPIKTNSTPTKEQIQIDNKTSDSKEVIPQSASLRDNFMNVYSSDNLYDVGVVDYIEEKKNVETSPTVLIKEEEDKQIIETNPIIPKEQIANNEKESVFIETLVSTESEDDLGVLPNVFTPNGDRVNDVLSIESKGLSDFSIVIIDRNSKIVFQSNDANFIWDGSGLNGETVNKGSYIYYITARNSKGELVNKHSVLNIETDR